MVRGRRPWTTLLGQFVGEQLRRGFRAQAVPAALLFQADEGGVPVVISDAELFPAVHPVDFLPQGLVLRRVEIQAPDPVAAARRVPIGPAHRPEPGPEGQPVGKIDLMLPLMPVLRHFDHVLSALLKALYHTKLNRL